VAQDLRFMHPKRSNAPRPATATGEVNPDGLDPSFFPHCQTYAEAASRLVSPTFFRAVQAVGDQPAALVVGYPDAAPER
jgi:hypothetical protein